MNHVDGHAPDLHVTATMQLQGRIGRIGGLQAQSALVLDQAFEGEFPSSTATTTRPGRGSRLRSTTSRSP